MNAIRMGSCLSPLLTCSLIFLCHSRSFIELRSCSHNAHGPLLSCPLCVPATFTARSLSFSCHSRATHALFRPSELSECTLGPITLHARCVHAASAQPHLLRLPSCHLMALANLSLLWIPPWRTFLKMILSPPRLTDAPRQSWVLTSLLWRQFRQHCKFTTTMHNAVEKIFKFFFVFCIRTNYRFNIGIII